MWKVQRGISRENCVLIIRLNPDCAIDICCGLKILAVPTYRDFTTLLLTIVITMPSAQNCSNVASRYGFLFLATTPAAQSGLNDPVFFELGHLLLAAPQQVTVYLFVVLTNAGDRGLYAAGSLR